MPIKIQCPLCRTEMTVSPAALGGVVGCPWCHHRFRAAPEAAEDAVGSPDSANRVPLAAPLSTNSPRKDAVASPKTPETKPTATSGGGATTASGRWKPVGGSEQDTALPPPPVPSSHPPPAAKREAAAAVPPKNAAKNTQSRAAPTERTKAVEGKGKKELKPDAAYSMPKATRSGGQSPTAGVVRGEPSASAVSESRAAAEAAKPTPPRKKAVMKILSEPVEPTWTLAADGSLPTLRLQESQTQDQAANQRSTNPLLLFVILCASMIVSLALVFIEPNPAEVGDTTARNAARRILTEEYIPSLNPQTPPADYQMLLREAQRAHNRGDLRKEKELYQQLLLLLYAHRDRAPYEGLTGSASRDRKLEEQLRILLRE